LLSAPIELGGGDIFSTPDSLESAPLELSAPLQPASESIPDIFAAHVPVVSTQAELSAPLPPTAELIPDIFANIPAEDPNPPPSPSSESRPRPSTEVYDLALMGITDIKKPSEPVAPPAPTPVPPVEKKRSPFRSVSESSTIKTPDPKPKSPDDSQTKAPPPATAAYDLEELKKISGKIARRDPSMSSSGRIKVDSSALNPQPNPSSAGYNQDDLKKGGGKVGKKDPNLTSSGRLTLDDAVGSARAKPKPDKGSSGTYDVSDIPMVSTAQAILEMGVAPRPPGESGFFKIMFKYVALSILGGLFVVWLCRQTIPLEGQYRFETEPPAGADLVAHFKLDDNDVYVKTTDPSWVSNHGTDGRWHYTYNLVLYNWSSPEKIRVRFEVAGMGDESHAVPRNKEGRTALPEVLIGRPK
jgi:hypothetical protein